MDWKYLYLSFDGRIGRQTYWIAFIVLMVVSVIAAAIDMVFGTYNAEYGVGLLSGIFSVACIYPSLAVYAKRWHDRGKSGWWTLIIVIPIIGAIWMFIELGFLRGTVGENQYGPDPVA